MGADLLRSIEGIFEPSHIVDFQLPGISATPDILLNRRLSFGEHLDSASTNTSANRISIMAIPPPPRPPRFSAAELRGLALVSYFHGHFSSTTISNNIDNFIDYWDTSLCLRAVAPIVVDTNLALESVILNVPGGDDVVPSELSRALICGVVGLVAPELPSEPSRTAYIQGTLPPSPQTSRCVGLAFIRGISDTKLQLLTPTPNRELGICRTIVLGELNMPVWAFLEQDGSESDQGGLPYLQWGRSVAENAGGERRRIRRNIMRRGQA
jgi:polynucleotide 5'-hydroxyl-kinase GRC3/NOL9